MKIKIISYSRTSNNARLADEIAKAFNAEQIRVNNHRSKSMLGIVFDIFLKKIPKVNPAPSEALDGVKKSGLVLFVGPVWMGKVATPFRVYLQYLKGTTIKYGFISVSGGALGPNEKLEEELKELTGRKPVVFENPFIADFLPKEPKPTVQDTMKYILEDKQITQLAKKVIKKIK